MKVFALLFFFTPLYLFAAEAPTGASSSMAQNPAQPPEPTPSTNKPDMPDTTLVGTKKQTKEAKKKANKQMKEKEKEVDSQEK